MEQRSNSFLVTDSIGSLMARYAVPCVISLLVAALAIAVGLAAGCIPIVGYNIGAGRKDRARSLFTRLLLAEAAVGAAALLIVEFLPTQLIAAVPIRSTYRTLRT